MRRIPLYIRRVLAVAGVMLAGATAAVAISASPAAATRDYEVKCFEHTFDRISYKGKHYWVALVKLRTRYDRCLDEELKVALVAYTAPSRQFAVPQYVYDSERTTINAENTWELLKVEEPPCYFQVDLVTVMPPKDQIFNPLDDDDRYGDR